MFGVESTRGWCSYESTPREQRSLDSSLRYASFGMTDAEVVQRSACAEKTVWMTCVCTRQRIAVTGRRRRLYPVLG